MLNKQNAKPFDVVITVQIIALLVNDTVGEKIFFC